MRRDFKMGLILMLAWITGWLAIHIWPELELAELPLSDKINWAFFFRPFHYLTAFLLLCFYLYFSLALWRLIVFEWQLYLILRHKPITAIVVALLLVVIHLRLINYFGLPAVLITAIVGTCETVYQVIRRKKELIVLKK